MATLSYPLPRQFPITRGFADTSILSAGGFGALGAHTGLDLGAPCGEPVLAAGPGVVSKVWDGAAALINAGGRHIIITHSDALQTEYMHLSAVYVRVGQVVAASAVIGSVGASGAATGCHLHFQVDLNGQPVDPGPYLGIGSTMPPGSTAGNVLAGAGTPADQTAALLALLQATLSGFVGVDTWRQAINTMHLRAGPGLSTNNGTQQMWAIALQVVGTLGLTDTIVQAADFPRVAAAMAGAGATPGSNVISSVLSLALPALLEPALNLAILGTAAVLIYAGIREAMSTS